MSQIRSSAVAERSRDA